jgi:hypothetical protein
VVAAVKANHGTLAMDDIEDLKVDDEETHRQVAVFNAHLESQILARNKIKSRESLTQEQMESFAREVPQQEMYLMVRKALFSTFKWDFITCASFTILGECTGIFSCYFISFLIKYLRNETAPYTEGIYLIIIFMAVSLVQQLCRNFYV